MAEAAAAPSHFVRWPSSVTNDGSDGNVETGEDMASDADALAGSAIADMPPVD